MRFLNRGDGGGAGHDEAERVFGEQLGVQFGVFGDVVVRVGFGEHHVVFAASSQGGSGFGVDLQYLQGE